MPDYLQSDYKKAWQEAKEVLDSVLSGYELQDHPQSLVDLCLKAKNHLEDYFDDTTVTNLKCEIYEMNTESTQKDRELDFYEDQIKKLRQYLHITLSSLKIITEWSPSANRTYLRATAREALSKIPERFQLAETTNP